MTADTIRIRMRVRADELRVGDRIFSNLTSCPLIRVTKNSDGDMELQIKDCPEVVYKPHRIVTIERELNPGEKIAHATKQAQLQKKEFTALHDLYTAYRELPPIVDDDYPRYRHKYEMKLWDFVNTVKENGRQL